MGLFATTRRRVRQVSLTEGYVQVGRHLAAVQTVVAAAKAAFAMALLSAATPVAPVAIALLAFAVYNANNLSDGPEDAVNCPNRARFVTRRSREIGVASVLAAAAAIGLATLWGGPLAGAVALAPVAGGVLYSVPIVPGDGPRRLKDVFLANTVLVAAAWAVTTVFLPATLVPGVDLSAALAVFGYFFLRTVVSVELFNVRDVAGDSESGVATMPVRLGLPDTRLVLVALDVFSLALVALAAPVLDLPAMMVAAVVGATAFSMCLTATTIWVDDWDLVCLAKDGEYIALGLVGLLVVW